MSVKERIVAIRLTERIARNREYADEIGVFVMSSKAEYNGDELDGKKVQKTELMKGDNEYENKRINKRKSVFEE